MTDTLIAPDDPRLASLILKNGAHTKPEDGMCLMEATAYLRGVAFSDHPACVAPTIGAAGRSFNDSLPTDEMRTRLCVPLIPIIVGTATTPADEETRAWLATDFLVREVTPSWMELAGLTDTASKLRALPPLTNAEIARGIQSLLEHARSESAAAWAAAWDAAGAAAGDAAWAAARDAAWAAAGDAAGAAAGDAAGAALKPTVTELQISALALVNRMIDASAGVVQK